MSLLRRSSPEPDLLAVVAWGLVAAVAATLLPPSPVRTVAAGSFLLLGPGYLLVAALFPRDDLSLLERTVFGAGASLGLAGLVGIPLSETWGVRLSTVVAAQLGLTLLLAGVAGVRRRGVEPEDRADPWRDLGDAAARIRRDLSRVGGGNRAVRGAILLSVLLAGAAAAYAVTTPLPSERYTELSVAEPDALLTNESLDAAAWNGSAGEPGITVTVRNNEHREVRYGLQLQVRSDDGARILNTSRRHLPHGAEGQKRLRIPAELLTPPDKPRDATIHVLLFRDKHPTRPAEPRDAYRHLRIVPAVEQDRVENTAPTPEDE